METAVRVLLGAVLGGTATWLLTRVGLRAPRWTWVVAATVAGILTGAVSFRPSHYDLGPALVSSMVAAALLAIAVCDLLERRIPNRLTYPLLVGSVCLSWIWPDRPTIAQFTGMIAAAGIVFAFAALGWALARTYQHGPAVGAGDMKLVLVLGSTLGWPLFLWALFLGSTLGGVAAVLALVTNRRTLAYGPYLAAGGLVALLWPATSPWT